MGAFPNPTQSESTMPFASVLLPAQAAGGAELDGLAGWVVDVMEAIGAPGAGLLVALENLFPPLPSPLAGGF